MPIIYLLCILASLLPVVLVRIYRNTVLLRKRDSLLASVSNVTPAGLPLAHSRLENISKYVSKEYEQSYSSQRILWPMIFLVLLYMIGFYHISELVAVTFRYGGSPNLFSRQYLTEMEPVLITFIGVYLFNLGHLVRRLYVGDLSQNVVLSSLNRLLLSLGIARVMQVLLQYSLGESTAMNVPVYFSIGFLTNSYLRWLLSQAAGKIFKVTKEELQLSAIPGITFWIENRLEEEGIETIQHLASSDPVSLAIKTQYDLYTLVDWVDRAILLDRLGKQGLVIQEKCLFTGAIDMAWSSPANDPATGTTVAALAAGVVGVDPLFMQKFMDNLYEDASVQTIWALWQTKR